MAESLEFTVYVHQITSGSGRNQAVVADPSNSNRMGHLVVVDWSVHEGPEANSTVIGRVRGQVMISNLSGDMWYNTFSILFQDDRFNGSSLEVRGSWVHGSPFECAIVGGTGQFTLAQGIIYGKNVNEASGTRMMQFSIRVFYQPLERLTFRKI